MQHVNMTNFRPRLLLSHPTLLKPKEKNASLVIRLTTLPSHQTGPAVRSAVAHIRYMLNQFLGHFNSLWVWECAYHSVSILNIKWQTMWMSEQIREIPIWWKPPLFFLLGVFTLANEGARNKCLTISVQEKYTKMKWFKYFIFFRCTKIAFLFVFPRICFRSPNPHQMHSSEHLSRIMWLRTCQPMLTAFHFNLPQHSYAVGNGD